MCTYIHVTFDRGTPKPLYLNRKRLLRSSKEFLALLTPFTLAARTPQTHLLATRYATFQVRFGYVCQCLDENRGAIQTFRSFDRILMARLANNLFIKLIQRLDMVRCECYGNENEIFLALGDVFGHGVACLGA